MRWKTGKVLIVDDEENVRDLIQRILKEAGYEVVTATDGEEAIDALRRTNVGVVLLDIKMPRMSGMEVLKHITTRRPDISVIMVTGSADAGTAVEAMKMGAYDYVTKPFDGDDLIRKVKMAAEKMTEKMTQEPVHVTPQKARLLERNYIVQTEARLKAPGGILNWDKVTIFTNVDKVGHELKRSGLLSPKAVRRSMPNGMGIKASVATAKLALLKRTSLVLGIRVLSNYMELALSGLDTEISFGELGRQVELAMGESRLYPFVLVLASTAGWSQEAVEYAETGKGLSPNLSLVLVDLERRLMHYNARDENLDKILPYLEV